jgi:ERF superfamily
MSETKITPAEFAVPPEYEEKAIQRAPMSSWDLIEMAVDRNAGIEVIERLKALYDQERSKREEADFNAAMSRVQSAIDRIAPDLNNAQTNSRYASYAAIDRVIRPVYSKEGFSLSFNTEESKIVCFASHNGGYTRRYEVDMPADGKGPKGGDVMTKTHATGSAMSYGQRYLVKFVFNLAIGTDDDGNAAALMPGEEEATKAIAEAPDTSALQKIFKACAAKAMLAKNGAAIIRLTAARDKRRAELGAEQPA